jgi:hypothetical protein
MIEMQARVVKGQGAASGQFFDMPDFLGMDSIHEKKSSENGDGKSAPKPS